jgi:hypothetical protein
MAQHPAEVSRLPKQLQEMLPAAERSNRQHTRPSKTIPAPRNEVHATPAGLGGERSSVTSSLTSIGFPGRETKVEEISCFSGSTSGTSGSNPSRSANESFSPRLYPLNTPK